MPIVASAEVWEQAEHDEEVGLQNRCALSEQETRSEDEVNPTSSGDGGTVELGQGKVTSHVNRHKRRPTPMPLQSLCTTIWVIITTSPAALDITAKQQLSLLGPRNHAWAFMQSGGREGNVASVCCYIKVGISPGHMHLCLGHNRSGCRRHERSLGLWLAGSLSQHSSACCGGGTASSASPPTSSLGCQVVVHFRRWKQQKDQVSR